MVESETTKGNVIAQTEGIRPKSHHPPGPQAVGRMDLGGKSLSSRAIAEQIEELIRNDSSIRTVEQPVNHPADIVVESEEISVAPKPTEDDLDDELDEQLAIGLIEADRAYLQSLTETLPSTQLISSLFFRQQINDFFKWVAHSITHEIKVRKRARRIYKLRMERLQEEIEAKQVESGQSK